ncbi:MAG TPA: MATE family efflux transporter, partial [Puia sp.]|nr:MATE family efflux transporter [Puia sp.]
FAVIHKKGVSKELNLLGYSGVDYKNLKLIMVQSSPLILQYAVSITSWEFFYILIEHHGREALAISNAMRNLFGVIGTFPWAFASTTNTMVSNAIGQGRQDKVIFLINRISILSVSICAVITLLLNFFPGTFLSIYGQDESFVEHAIPIIRVVSGAIMLMSIGAIWLNAVTGTGNTKVNLAIELIVIFFYSIYIYLVLSYWNLPIIYGWMSEWFYWTFTFTLSYLYIRSRKWEKKVV